MEKPKVSVLVCGDVLGKFKSLFSRISKLCQAKQSFEALYCVGSFFGENNSQWQLVKTGKIKVPIPCYILGPSKPEHNIFFPDPNGGELAPNVLYLGKKGILSSTSGLRVAYLSGVEGNSAPHTFSAKDITILQDSFQNLGLRGVDFLLTSPWPKYVTKSVPTPVQFQDLSSSELISYLAATIKPCYHFSGLEGVFMERLPYRNTKMFSDKASHFTRFVGLGEVSNSAGMQFLYGLNHCPLLHVTEKDLLDQKLNEVNTECPYQNSVIPVSRLDVFEKPRSKAKQQQTKKSFPDCWFCLSCPIEKHLLVAIGEFCYISLAKGWLIPDHLLIISNVHHNSTANLTEDEASEMDYFKYAIERYFYSKQKDVVFFERSYKSPHLQLQAVAVPQDLKPAIENIFTEAALKNNVPLEEIPPYSVMKQVVGTKKPFFCLEIKRANCRPKKYLHVIEEEFPIQFSREVLASKAILNVPHRANWRDCAPSQIDDTTLCKSLSNDFRKILSEHVMEF